MRKVAIFVEGMTESVFTERLLQEICTKGSMVIHKMDGSKKGMYKLQALQQFTGAQKAFILLIDCRGDESVKTRVLENRENLTANGYDAIIALRDLYPLKLSDLGRLEANLKKFVPTSGIPIHMHIAVAEIEAWFIQEGSHFARIDSALSTSLVSSTIGFNADTDCAESLAHPADTLHQAYKIVGKSYKKKTASVTRTVGALDIPRIYIELEHLVPRFKAYADAITTALGI